MPRPIGEATLRAGSVIEAGPPAGAEQVQQTFDEYSARYQAQPSDEEAAEGMRSLMGQALERGDVDFLMYNAMTLAAQACLDPHMEDIAAEAGSHLKNSMLGSHEDGLLAILGTSSHETDSKGRKKKSSELAPSIFRIMMKRAYPPKQK